MRNVALVILLAAGSSDLGLAQDPLLTEAEARREVRAIGRLQPEARARIEALLYHARLAGLPTQPIIDRLEAGQVRRLPSIQLVNAAEATVARLETVGREFRDGGRLADQREIILAELLLERGGTPAQLSSLVGSVSPARSLLVPLGVMVRLAARGVDPARVVEEVERQLAYGADDQTIAMLLTSTISKN